MKKKSNILLIAGTGRNVGKTMLACNIISHLSKKINVTGIKISNHFHPVEPGQKIILKTQNYTIFEEMLISKKDSSRMKQAGAKKVFCIQSKHKFLLEAFDSISTEISGNPVVCESGGLNHFIKPGIFLFVKGKDFPVNKTEWLNYNPVIVTFKNNKPSLNPEKVQFRNTRFFIES